MPECPVRLATSGADELRLFRKLLRSRKPDAVIWSGRWESNPTPNTAKSLNQLADTRRLPSTTVHNRRDPFDSLPLRLTHNVAINLKRCPSIGVSQLTLNNLGRGLPHKIS